MARLIYSAIASLDGYVADEDGSFDWAQPDEEVHRFVNEQERGVGTYLLGRRMFETMRFWDSPDIDRDYPTYIREYAEIWREKDKVVYSRTLGAISSPRTRVVHDFDPAVVERLKRSSERDLSIGGATLAASAMHAGLVDICDLYLAPVVVGGGLPAFPHHFQIDLELAEEHRFDSGFVHLRYSVR